MVFTAGLALVVAGVAGLALPILPGWVLIIAGIAIWSREFSWAMRLRQWVTDHVRDARDKVREKVLERTAEHHVSRRDDTGTDRSKATADRAQRTSSGIDAA